VLDCLADAGISAALEEYLGERPCFSLQKSTLRRSVPEARYVTWHQDGAFLGPDVRTMNVWIALTSCGGTLPTPALEIVPRSMPGILPTKDDAGGFISNSVPDEIAAAEARACPAVIPEFGPGDALIFDERLLHRTHLSGDMTEIRYALECWFFAPSHRPPDYTPLLV
jgi:ectoine hydroxylase-related dioxygenase (phytanoyl-CoA dioxygenase family)